MRNILSFLGGRAYTWFIIALASAAVVGLVLFLLMARAGAHEAHPVPTKVGNMHGMTALCDARGASAVARAGLVLGSFKAGNLELDAQTKASPARCSVWREPIGMKVLAVAYVGTQRGLHVYIVKFGIKGYAVMSVRRAPLKTPAGYTI